MKRAHDIKNTPEYEPVRYALEDAIMTCGKSIEGLARELKMPKTALYNIMNGTRRVDVVEFHRIAIASGQDPVELFKRSINMVELVGISEGEDRVSPT